MKMKTFKQYINEIWYRGDTALNGEFVRPKGLVVNDPIYVGEKFTLWQTKRYFIVTEGDKEVFYLQYKERRGVIWMESRENTSQSKNLFWRVVYTLLFLGYSLKEDYVHNKLSINAINKIIKMGYIDVYLDGEIVDRPMEYTDGYVDDKMITYRISKKSERNLLESCGRFVGDDLMGNYSDLFIGLTENEDG